MIIKYDLKQFFKDKKVSKANVAKKIGISRQLLNYHLNKGDLPMSMFVIIAEEVKTPVDKLIKIIETKYIKTKI